MITRQSLTTWAMALSLACACASTSVAQQQPTPRSRDTRGNDERVAYLRCLSQTTAAYADYLGPQSAREAGQASYLMTCVANTMPADWLSAPDYRTQAERLAQMARRSDPAMDDCLLSACIPLPSR